MTEFHLAPDEAHSPGAFALPRSPASVPTGGLCHSTRVTSGPTTPSAFATSARRVLQALPGLLYLTTYPNPMSILARMMAQRNHQTPPDGVLRVVSPCPHIEAGESKTLRNAFFNRRGRSSSMTNFDASPQHGGQLQSGGQCLVGVGLDAEHVQIGAQPTAGADSGHHIGTMPWVISTMRRWQRGVFTCQRRQILDPSGNSQ